MQKTATSKKTTQAVNWPLLGKQFLRYGIAVGIIGVVTLVKSHTPGLGESTPTLLYSLALMIIAIFLGTRPALLALAVSTVLIPFLFLSRTDALSLGIKDLVQIIIYLIDGILVIFIISRLRNSERQLRDKNIQLQDSNNRMISLMSKALDAPYSRKRPDDDIDI